MEKGITNGRLQPVEDKPNSVSTQTEYHRNYMKPVPFTDKSIKAIHNLKLTLEKFERIELVEEQGEYLHYVETSKLFKFKDDVEFFFDESRQLIHFRSKSRVGYTDFGVNRRRMNKIFKAYLRS